MGRRPVTDLDRSIVAAYRRLRSVEKAAAKAGASVYRARKVLAASGEIASRSSLPAWMVREVRAIYAEVKSSHLVVGEMRRRYPGQRTPSRSWVRATLKAYGELLTTARASQVRAMREHGRDFDALRAEAARLATDSKLSAAEIGRRLQVSEHFALAAMPSESRLPNGPAHIRRAWEAELPDVEARLDRRAEVIYRRRDLGQTHPEISAATGIPKSTVRDYLRAAGLTGKAARRRAIEARLRTAA